MLCLLCLPLFFRLFVIMCRKGKDVSDEVRAVICTMFKNGKKVTAIAKDLSMSRGTVNTIIQRYKKAGQMKKGKRTGRPPKLTPRDERRLSRLILRNRRTPLMQILATFTASNDVSISNRIFDKYCRRMGFSWGPSVKKQVLQPRHRRIRLEWCKPRRFWNVDDHWSRVIFSDESMIKVGVKSRFKVMVWGCITPFFL